MDDRHSFNIDIHKLMRTLSEILSEVYDCDITLTAIRKEPDTAQKTAS